ncbi:MAG: FAD/NAD(P)-binding protein, partial [Gammaproteobacteria bacterium]|nr:FAD/NAD(P)-binding protein [Gammaproteobacteria bacterium]
MTETLLPTYMTDQRSQFDIAFVGGGLSSTWSLIQLVQNLPSERVTPALRLLLLEKSTDTYKGIAYGERSGDTALIINSLGDFLPPDELKRFTEWIVKNIDWLFDRFKASGGARTTEWLRKHAAEIEAGELSMLYIPRYLFGLYLENLASICLDTATANGLVEFEAIQAEVIDLVPGSDNYRIHAESCDMSHHEYLASKVILGLGSPPGKKVVTKADLEHQSDPVIGNPFEPSMRATLESVHSRLEQTCRESNRVLIVGSNASAVDMVCNLADYKNVIELIDTVVLMSPSGELPDR